jgi:serine/threonine protein kinase
MLAERVVTRAHSTTRQAFSTRRDTSARFRLLEKVHESSMSIVWRAFDEVRRMPVAVKLVPQNLAPAFDSKDLARLVRVSEHSGLMTLIEHGWQDHYWYQIAEWLDGTTLASLCRPNPIPYARSASFQNWMKQIAGALEAKHSAGFIHGDVKPSNVFVTSGQARLIDFPGLRIGDSWARHGRLTPAFASPEASQGVAADPRDDVYSLAAMIGKLLIGKLVSAEQASSGLAPPPAGVTPAQWELLLGVLDSNRESRVGSTVQLVDAMWPASAFPLRQPLPIVPQTSVPLAPAFAGKSRRRRRIREWRVEAKAGLTAALAALVVVGIGTEQASWRIRDVPEVSEPIAEPIPQLSRIERVDAQPTALALAVTASAFEPPARRSSTVVRASASRAFTATPASANSVVRSTGMAGLRDTAPAPLERAEVVATAERSQGRVADRPDASAFADRAEVPVLPDRAQMPRAKADPAKPHPLAMPAVAYRVTATAMPVRADASVAGRIEAPAVPDRSEVRAAPDRPEAPAILAVIDRPDRPERPEKLERPEKPERAERIERPDKPERPEIAERPDRLERPEKPERPERIDRPERVERPEKPERPERIERPDKPERPERVERPDRPERPEKPEKPERPEKPDKPERPEKPERPL